MIQRQDVWYMNEGALTYTMCKDTSFVHPSAVMEVNKWGLGINWFTMAYKINLNGMIFERLNHIYRRYHHVQRAMKLNMN